MQPEARPAEQLVGIINAASEAIECWFALGDPATALEAAAGARRAAAGGGEVGQEIDDLSKAAPAPVLKIVSDRVARHWRAYERALAEERTPEQNQAIHLALLACLNRELQNLREIEPELSPGVMRRWWVEYS